jgi:beta-lactamase regulating signal transducer with metallopeptidase domain
MNSFLTALGRVSAQAALLVFLVLLAQWLFKSRLTPRWRCALWLLPAIRLLLPVSISSTVSLFNLIPSWQQPANVANPKVGALPLPIGSGAGARDVRKASSRNVADADVFERLAINPPPRKVTEQRHEWDFDPSSTAPGEGQHRISDGDLRNTVTSPPNGTARATPEIALVSRLSWPRILFLCWSIGAAALIARILFTCRQLSRVLADAKEVSETTVLHLFTGCADELGVKAPVRLVESRSVSSPLIHGFLRPRLLLPIGLSEDLSWDELRFVLLHELAHVKRRDILQNWLGTLLQIVHWFNPLIWLAFARWRADRELACDALALETAGAEKKCEYGRTILRLLEASPRVLRAPAMVGILEDKRQLRERIAMIAAFAPGRRWSFLAILLLFALGLAGLTDARRAVQAAAKEAKEIATRADGGTPPVFESRKEATPKPTAGRAVKVTVLNEQGEPLKGAKILAPHSAAFFMGPANAPMWETDASGIAEILLGEPPEGRLQQNGWFTMSVRHPAYAPLGMSWNIPNGDARSSVPAELKAVLKKGVSLGGVVQDARGQRLAGVRIGLFGSSYSYQGGPQAFQTYAEYSSDARSEPAAITDANGRWSVSNVPAELEHLNLVLIRPDGGMYSFANYSSENPFQGVPEASLNNEKLRAQSEVIVLKDGFTVRGRVLDPAGQPVPNLLLREVHDRYQPYNGLEFRTDANGKFDLRNRQQRQILLTALPDHFAILSHVIDLGEDADVTLRLGKLDPLRIRVVDENGRPLPGVIVGLDPFRSTTVSIALDLKTDATGTAIWTNAPGTGFALIASATNGLHRKIRDLDGKREVQIQLRAGADKEIAVNAKAVDAETGEPVKVTSARFTTDDFSAHPQAEKPNDSAFRIPVRADQFQQGMYPTFRLQCEAEGYVTFTSERRDFDEGDWDVQVKMKRGGKPGGVLLLSDGMPAAGAEVTENMREQNFLFMNTPGKVYRNDSALRVMADDQGQFELKDPGFDGLVLITHDDGFLETSIEKLKSHPKLTLQRWGAIEGVMKAGENAVANAAVNLNGQSFQVSSRWNFILSAQTDGTGAFSFPKVPPGEPILYRYFDRVPGPITETYQMPVLVKPGETANVVYGGTGRPLIGQVEGNADWKNDVHLLVRKDRSNDNPPVKRGDFFDPEEFSKRYSEWVQKDQVLRKQRERNYYVNFAPDGSFRIEDVPAGTYELRIKVTEPLKPGENRYGPVSSDKIIASLTREVVVPEISGGRSNEPLDLGILELEWKRPQSSLPPIAFTAQTLDGKTFSLEALRGKFVVLNFWTTWSDNSQEQMADITALSARFKDDARVAFVGVNLGEAPDRVRKRAQANNYTTDQVVLSGAALASTTEALNLDALPSAFIIGPNGRIVTRDLKGDTLERSLESALKRQGKGKE